ncbi:MAG: SDR family NAD(P)-dependent oxidoreductase [Firmicutes bacterium]|nr:SDR family NAD(P)-dependent oxidoreductase [Bacillota bacterium]
MKNNVVIVTGAGNGIGAATAKIYAQNGYKVGVLDIKETDAAKVVKEIEENGGTAISVVCDVGLRDSVEAAVKKVESLFGDIGTIVNNAGIGGPFHRVDEVEDDEWDMVVRTNQKSVFMFSRILLPKMKEAGFGRIVNVSSIQGLLGSPYSSTYVATKHAVIGYTRTIAAEWGRYGITCNAVCPGFVLTAMGARDDELDDYTLKVMAKSPVKILAKPEDIGNLIYYLTGEHGQYINGSIINIDGGITSHVGIMEV